MGRISQRTFEIADPLETFCGREDLLEVFQQQLASKDPEDNDVLVFHGVGGIGKSTLLKKMEADLDGRHAHARLDFAQVDNWQVFRALLRLKAAFPHTGFPSFSLAAIAYAKRTNREAASLKNKGTWLDDAGPFFEILDLALGAPVVGFSLRAIVTGERVHRLVKDSRLKRIQADLADLDTVDPDVILGRLPQLWARDFKEGLGTSNRKSTSKADATAACPVVFIDTYEAFWRFALAEQGWRPEDREAWLIRLIEDLPEILWVVAGRDALTWAKYNPEWAGCMKQFDVGPLPAHQAAAYLKASGVAEPEIRSVMVQCSAGLPFYLDAEVKLYRHTAPEARVAGVFGGSHEDVVDRLLTYLDVGARRTMYALSAFREWDGRLFDDLTREFGGFQGGVHRFERFWNVRRIGEDHWQLHDVLANHLQRHQQQAAPTEYRRVHEFAFKRFDSLLDVPLVEYGAEQVQALTASLSHAWVIKKPDQVASWFWARERTLSESGAWRSLIGVVGGYLDKAERRSLGVELAFGMTRLGWLLARRGQPGDLERAKDLLRSGIERARESVGADDVRLVACLQRLASLAEPEEAVNLRGEAARLLDLWWDSLSSDQRDLAWLLSAFRQDATEEQVHRALGVLAPGVRDAREVLPAFPAAPPLEDMLRHKKRYVRLSPGAKSYVYEKKSEEEALRAHVALADHLRSASVGVAPSSAEDLEAAVECHFQLLCAHDFASADAFYNDVVGERLRNWGHYELGLALLDPIYAQLPSSLATVPGPVGERAAWLALQTGMMLDKSGRPDIAEERFKRAAIIFQDLGKAADQALALRYQAEVAAIQGRVHAARLLLDEAEAVAGPSPALQGERGVYAAWSGDWRLAETLLRGALHGDLDTDYRCWFTYALAEVLLAQGRASESDEFLDRAQALAEKHTYRDFAGWIYLIRGRRAWADGDAEAARASVAHAVRIAEAIGYVRLQAEAVLARAEILLPASPDEAEADLLMALALAEQSHSGLAVCRVSALLDSLSSESLPASTKCVPPATSVRDHAEGDTAIDSLTYEHVDPFDTRNRDFWIKLEHLGRYAFARAVLAEQRRPGPHLDLGCGSGYGLSELDGLADVLVGVDYDPQAVRESEEAVSRLRASVGHIIQADLDRTDLSEALAAARAGVPFGSVTAFEVLEHLDDPGRVIDGLHALMLPGAPLLTSTPNPTHEPINQDGTPHDRYHDQILPLEQVRQMLRSAGFRVLDEYGQGLVNHHERPSSLADLERLFLSRGFDVRAILGPELVEQLVAAESAPSGQQVDVTNSVDGLHARELLRSLARTIARPTPVDIATSYSFVVLSTA